MNTTDTAREARTRNLARLRKLTIVTAALGVAASTGFGYLAAMTYTGTTAASATGTANTAFATTTTSGASTVPLVTTTTRTAHVRSGGS